MGKLRTRMRFGTSLGKVVMICLVVSSSLFAQQKKRATVSGFVYDKSTGETLIGATVFFVGTRLGGTTNNNGYFVISDVPVGVDTLVVSYLGYDRFRESIRVGAVGGRLLRINLVPKAYRIGEVIVTADSLSMAERAFKRPVSTLELTQSQVNAIPKFIEPDLLRALESLPGITPISDFSSALYVRGGTPDQNLYLIDGAEIYEPEHAFGIFSTFNTDAIKRVMVSKGGFGAQYGDRLSSVIDVTELDGNRRKFEANANISLIAASATVQMPVWSFGSIAGSFRRTYIDQTYAKFIKDFPNYYFDDGNLTGKFQLDDRDNLTLNYFGSEDNLNYQFDKSSSQSPILSYSWGNNVASVRWDHIFGGKLLSTFLGSYSGFVSNFGLENLQAFNERNTISNYTLSESVRYYASNATTLRFGAAYQNVGITYGLSTSDGAINFDGPTRKYTGYAILSWQPDPLWDLEAGLRFEQFRSSATFTHVDPRVAIKYRLSETSSLKIATGIYHQYMDSVDRLFFASIWLPAGKYIDNSKATHFILGYDKQLGNIFELEANAYYKSYSNIDIYNQNLSAQAVPSYYLQNGNPVYTSDQNVFLTGNGKSFGLELLLRKDEGAVTGWVGYALSRTEYVFPAINQGNMFIPRQDRTSVVNFVLNGDIGDIVSGKWNEPVRKSASSWLLGLNFIFTTGQPLTVPASVYFVNTLPAWDNYGSANQNLPNYQLYPGPIDNYRLPDYARLDLSITWKRDYGTWSLAPYLQIFNLGDRKNVWFIRYSSKNSNGEIVQDVKPVYMLPFLPSIGVTIKF